MRLLEHEHFWNFYIVNKLYIYFRYFCLSNRIDIPKKKTVNCIERFRENGREMVSCELCTKYPETLKLYIRNQRHPKIATRNGTGYRSDVIENHLITDYHIACVNIERIKLFEMPDKALTPMDVSMNNANVKQANNIDKLMIQIYGDAKMLTLAAWHWPARFVASEASNAFQYNQLYNIIRCLYNT